jgi:hypothetical protein
MAKRRPIPIQEDPVAEQLAWLMDGCFKIGPYKIGLDPLLGLVPGLGDITSSAISAVIIWRAMQNGVPRSAILRMVANVGLDSLVGAIPLAGDLFDFAFKANVKNLEIYRGSISGTRKPMRDWGFITLIGLLLLALLALPILGLIFLGTLLAPHMPVVF